MSTTTSSEPLWYQLLCWLGAIGVGVAIFEQSDGNKDLAQEAGSYFHAGFISLSGSTVIGWMLLAPALLLLSVVVRFLYRGLHWSVLDWEYKLNFRSLLREMRKPGNRRWWFVGIPGGAFLPAASFSILLIGPMPTIAFALAGWASYAVGGIFKAPREKRSWLLLGVILTFVGVGFGIMSANVGLMSFSRDLGNYGIGPVVSVISASIMWQLMTLGVMGAGPNSSRLAASLVSWMGGALTIAIGIGVLALSLSFYEHTSWQQTALEPFSRLPSLPDNWYVYRGMAYGAIIIGISALVAWRLRSVRFVVAVAAGFAAAGFYHALVAGLYGIAVLLAVACGVFVTLGVWTSMYGMSRPPRLTTPLEKAA